MRTRHADTHGISDHCLMLSTVMRGTNTMEIEKSDLLDFFRGSASGLCRVEGHRF